MNDLILNRRTAVKYQARSGIFIDSIGDDRVVISCINIYPITIIGKDQILADMIRDRYATVMVYPIIRIIIHSIGLYGIGITTIDVNGNPLIGIDIIIIKFIMVRLQAVIMNPVILILINLIGTDDCIHSIIEIKTIVIVGVYPVFYNISIRRTVIKMNTISTGISYKKPFDSHKSIVINIKAVIKTTPVNNSLIGIE